MPYLYVYSASDFIGGLPDEEGAKAEGSGPWDLTLAPGATPTLIEVSDDDAVFDEVDNDQTLANGINLDGTSYGAGTSIHSAYDLVNSDSGHQVTSLHFGGNGYQQGTVHGLVSSVPLTPGETYSFDTERTSHRQANDYENFVACFVEGTLIRTKQGDLPVEMLKAGDLIATVDGSFEPLKLALHRSLSADELAQQPKLKPVRITAGAMGQGLPSRDLWVSPQHRMLSSGPACERMFEQAEVLLSARKLTNLPGIYVDEDCTDVTYWHLVFKDHQVIFAENAPSESFYFGIEALNGLDHASLGELKTLFPEFWQTMQAKPQSARTVPKDAAQKSFVMRLQRNGHSAISS